MVKKGGWRASRKCQECKGTGKVEQEQIENSRKGSNISVQKIDCPVCKGQGWFTTSGSVT